MRLMFISDIHGSAACAEKAVELFSRLDCDKLIILGDILYHGARNDLPEEYNPKAVIRLLNSCSESILAVRGNCDSEVDQMVLDFPCMSDYILLYEKQRCFFITHGHIYNTDNPPKIKSNDILIHGHTHIQTVREFDGRIYINPGSITLPKEGNPQTFMLYEDGKFTIYDMDMNCINSYTI